MRIATLEIVGTDDSIDEGDSETVSLSFGNVTSNLDLVSGTGASGTTASGTVAVDITDDEATPTVTLALAPSSIAESGQGNSSTVTATLGGRSSKAVVLTVSAVPVLPAVAGDITLSGDKELTIAAGALSSTGVVTVTANDNDIDHANRQMTVSATVTGGHGVLAPADATLTITDDDERGVVISESSVSVRETDATGTSTIREDRETYTVKLASEPTGGSVTVAVASADSAVATAEPATLVFTATNWSTAQTVTVSGVNDDVDNTNDRRTTSITHTVSAQGTDYVSEPVDPVAVTVTDDDGPPTGVSLSVSPDSVGEGAGAASVTVTAMATGGSTFARATTVRVTVGAATDSADSPADYAAVAAFDITIPAGVASGTRSFTLTPVSDDVDEGVSETISVTGVLTDFTVAAAGITLTDDDERGITVSPVTLTLGEVDNASTQNTTENADTYDVVLTSEPTGTVTVTLGNSEATAVSLSHAGLSFNATNWDAAQTVTVTAIADAFDNAGDKRTATITHTVSATGTDYSGETADPVVVTVTDDDDAPTAATLSVTPASVSEGAGSTAVTVTATLSGTSRFAESRTVAVTVGDTDDNATAGTDYTEVDAFSVVIAGGAASGSQTFDLVPSNDNIYEGTESISVKGTLAGVTVEDARITLTDNDNAPGGITLTVSPASVSEGAAATDVTVTATVTGGTTYDEAKTVAVVIGAGTDSATEGTDYETVGAQTITIDAGKASGATVFKLTPKDDSADEAAETISVDGTSGSLTVTDAAIKLTDDDETPVALSRTGGTAFIEENGGSVDVTIDLGRALVSGESVTVPLVVSAATVTTHYTLALKGTPSGVTLLKSSPHSAQNPALRFTGPGAASATLTLTAVNNDDTAERTVSIAYATGARKITAVGLDGGFSASGSPLSVPIADDDSQITIAAASAAEGSAVVFTVTLPRAAPSGGVTIDYATSDGRGNADDAGYQVAAAADDYTAADASLTIDGGERIGTISIATAQDTTYEGDHYFTVTLSNPTRMTVSSSAGSAVGTITDADDTPGFAFSSATGSVAENVGAGTVTLTVSKTGATLVASTVDYATTDGTAKAGDDYTAASGTLSFAAGDTSKTFTVPIADDVIDEAGETFAVDLAAGAHAKLGTVKTQTVTITDDDAAPGAMMLSVDADTGTTNVQSAVTENGGAKTVRVTAKITSATRFSTDQTVKVTVGKAGDSAESGEDYAAVADQTITIKATEASGYVDFTLTPDNDVIDDDGESISVEGELDGITFTNASIGITDDDAAPGGITLTVSPASISEGAAAVEVTVTATVDGGTTFAGEKVVTVSVGEAADSAKPGTDYAAVNSFTISVAAGASSATGTFDLDPTDDALDEASESVLISGTVNGATVTSSQVTITDNDDPPVLSVSAPGVDEGNSGSASLAFQITLSEASGQQVTVGYADSGTGTATSGTDYAALTAGTLTFAAGETSKTVTVSVTGDGTDEPDETVVLRLSSAVNATLSGGVSTLDGTGTITDDDDAPTVSVADASAVSEGDDSSRTTDMTFTVTLSSVSGKTVTVPYTLDGSATAGDDYVKPNPLSVTIAPGSTSASIVVDIKGDEVDEINETVTVTLVNPTNATVSTAQGAETASGTITDDEATPTVTLALAPSSIAESGQGNSSTVTATLGGRSSKAVVLTVSAVPVLPAVAGDITLSGDKELTIAAGALSSTGVVTVTANDNDIDHANRQMTVSATVTGGHGVLAPADATLTITDDDERGVVISESSVSVRETDATGTSTIREDRETYTVKLASEPTGGSVTVAVASADSAVATAEPATLVFTATNWSTAQTVTVNGVNDDIDNAAGARETSITHAVSAQGTDYVSVTADSVTVSVADDDAMAFP